MDGYIKEEESGKELSNDQKKAVANYDEVVNQLGISKEFCKQIQVIANLASKEAKRVARKAIFERQMQETSKVREVIIVQDFLRQLKNECIRKDFLQGSNGACLIEVEEMNVLEQFSKHIIPIHPSYSNEPSFMNSAKSAADHLSLLVDGRNRQFMETGFTYEKIKELFNRIQTCGYWEKDMRVVETSPQQSSSIITQERPAESETPQSSDLESKDDKMEENNKMSMPLSAPLPAQVPNPTQLFNGMMPPNHAVPMHIQMSHPQSSPQQQQQQQQQVGNVQMKTTVTAVENAFFNQMKYSQGPMTMGNQPQQQQVKGLEQNHPPNANAPNRIFEDFATANISFLQDSLVEQQQHLNNQSQVQVPQKLPNNNFISQPIPSPVQTQQQPPLAANAPHQAISSFHQPQTHLYPPGLKLQQSTISNIPGTFTQQQQPPQQQQQQQASQAQIHHQQSYQAAAVVTTPQQYQQKLPKNIPNLQEIEQKTTSTLVQQNHDLSNRTNNNVNNSSSSAQHHHHHQDNNKDKNVRNNEWNAENNQQQPQIDTWTNETSMGNTNNNNNNNNSNTNNGNNNGSGNYSRFNRNGSRGSNGGVGGQNAKFNNYR